MNRTHKGIKRRSNHTGRQIHLTSFHYVRFHCAWNHRDHLIFWKEPTVFPRLTVSVKWVLRSKENHPVSWYTGKVCGLTAPASTLNVGNSGTTTRLISGILSGQNFATTLSGDDSLNSRPMKRIMTPLNTMGAHIRSLNDNGCAPLHIRPGALHGIHYQSPVASAQVKSAVLLAGLYADSPTSVTEPALSRNHTELMLQGFGAYVATDLHTDGTATAHVEPCKELYGQQICVPGDISSAAYFIAAALLVPGSELLVKNVGTNFTRAGFLKVCKAMGADIETVSQTIEGGESRADLLVRYSHLKGTVIEGDIIPTLIDEIPMIAIMAAFADGQTVIRDAAELKGKRNEPNRYCHCRIKSDGSCYYTNR